MIPTDKPLLIFTGGHHSGALPVAKKLLHKGWQIIWFGHKYSMWGDQTVSAEYRQVTEAGIPFYELKAGKLFRTYHPLKLIRIPLGFVRAFRMLLQLKFKSGYRLKGIVSFGGYLAVPTVIAGWLLGIKSITHEQTLSTGWANKLLSYFTVKIAVAWPQSAANYPSSKVVVTGLPLRPEIIAQKHAAVKKTSPPTVYITGGKQGSHIINELVFSALPILLPQYRIIHQTGSSTLYNDHHQARQISESLPADQRPRYSFRDYYSDSETAENLHLADVVVSRSGAHICYELLFLGKPSVLIPIPWVSHSEQTINAQFVADSGLAVVLSQDKLSPSALNTAIIQALKLTPTPVDLTADATENLIRLINTVFN